ncbi:MAG: hypothetical protein V4714_12670 [Bacteroidota bacterium]
MKQKSLNRERIQAKIYGFDNFQFKLLPTTSLIHLWMNVIISVVVCFYDFHEGKGKAMRQEYKYQEEIFIGKLFLYVVKNEVAAFYTPQGVSKGLLDV